MKKNKILAMVLLTTFAFNASAAPSLNSILNQVLGNESTDSSDSGSSNKKRTTGDKQVDQILTKYGSMNKQGAEVLTFELDVSGSEAKMVSGCSKYWLDTGHKMVSENMKSDYKYSIEVAKKYLSYASQCALLDSKYDYKDSVTQNDFVYSSGYFLAVDAILSHDLEKKTEAEALIAYVKGPNDTMIQFMNKSLGLNAPVKNKPDFSGSAFSMVNNRAANPFAFDDKYEGRIMEISGKIDDIRGDYNNTGVLIVVKGSNKSKDLINFSDYVQCRITNETEMKKTYALKRGNPVKFKGVYHKQSLHLLLNDCGLVQ